MRGSIEDQIQLEKKDNIPINCHETFCEGEYGQVMRNDGTRWICQIAQEKKPIGFVETGNGKFNEYENLIEDVRDEQEAVKKELITKQVEAINRAKKNGQRSALWHGNDWKYAAIEDEVQRIFENKGYKVKPVWQQSKDICW